MLGGLLCDQGDFAQVAQVLRPVVARLGNQGNVAWNFSTALAMTGAHDELLALRPVLDRLAEGDVYPPYQHLAMARLTAQLDRDQALSSLRDLEASPRWLDAEATLAALATAVAEATPFAAIRLDIAQAWLVALCSPNAQRLLRPEERLAARDQVWTDWFGQSSRQTDAAELAALDRSLLDAVSRADLIMVPDSGDMAREHRHFGFIAETHRLLRASSDAMFAGTHAAVQMHQATPYLRRLLVGLPFLGFIGPYPSMARKLAHFSGVSETAFIRVPASGTPPFPEDAPDASGFLAEGHTQALAEIVVPFPGALFLVSAPGPLGAIYAARIKQQGGIALDIGPLATDWAR